MKTKEMKGITLVALVVTIVILLILAGVSINLVLGNNGIIAKAKDATLKWQILNIDAAKVLNNSTAYWVAARCVFTDSNDAYFGLRYADTGTDGAYMFHACDSSDGSNYRLRSVVSLSSSILSNTKDESGAWNLK